jgi:hypothetical protein
VITVLPTKIFGPCLESRSERSRPRFQHALQLYPRPIRYIDMDTVEAAPGDSDLLHELDEFLTAVPHRTNYSEAERHQLMNLLLDLRRCLLTDPAPEI